MFIDAALFLGLVEKAVLLVFGGVLTYFLERRTRLIVYFSHVGVFRTNIATQAPTQAPAQPPTQAPAQPTFLVVHTHSVVIRNAGKRAATNVRVPHRIALLPNNIHVSVDSNTNYTTNPLPGGGEELLFPVLAPQQHVTISYLYFPPRVFNQIHDQISCDEMIAEALNVPKQQWPRWAQITALLLLVLGIITLIYFCVEVVRFAVAHWPA